MTIATEVDALVRRRRGAGPLPEVDGVTSAQVNYYCRQGRDLQAQAMNAALRKIAAGVLAPFSAVVSAARHKSQVSLSTSH